MLSFIFGVAIYVYTTDMYWKITLYFMAHHHGEFVSLTNSQCFISQCSIQISRHGVTINTCSGQTSGELQKGAIL